MKILVTGAAGFVGKNLIAQLENINSGKEKNSPLNHILQSAGQQLATDAGQQPLTIFKCDLGTTEEELDGYCKEADFIVHLAGVNRPKDESEFMKGNADFTSQLLGLLEKHNNKATILLSSSIQAELDNPYGRSKKAGEEILLEYSKRTGAKVLIYRFTNLFGKWCRPNYNSVVATFCNNIANGLDITINDPSVTLNLCYIDDVVEELIRAIVGQQTEKEDGFCHVSVVHQVKLGEIAELLYGFKEMRNNLEVPKLDEPFQKKLYSTYLSYLPVDSFRYKLKPNVDNRGSFTEIIRTADRGQFSVNISKPGITKGNHWHHTKNEKFLVVSGHGLIELRRVGLDEEGKPYPKVSFEVRGEDLEVIEMIPGYTHNIINLSETEDLVTFMWANEAFDQSKPDTYFEIV